MNDEVAAPDLMERENPLIVIASNRGPYSFKYDKNNGTFSIKRGAGGLVTALGALAEKHEVLWVAAALGKGDARWAQEHPQGAEVGGVSLRLFTPSKKSYAQYYTVIANPLLWFIQHQLWDSPRSPSITKETWEAWKNGYVRINRQVADTIIDSVESVSNRPVIICPQDYHLYLVPQFLRQALGDRVQIQPFIHIPWPGPDAWQILPGQMRTQLLEGLLASDRIGFQTKKDAFNFVQTARFYLNARAHGSRDSVEYKGRRIKAVAYPISVDVETVEALASTTETQLLKGQIMNFIGDRQVILRTDRIELSKNILRGLDAFRILLEEYPDLRGKVVMIALLVPSRMEVDEYQNYFKEIMASAGLINAEYSDELWEPVRIIVGSNYGRAIAAMQHYDVLLVNPLADGMNLVAKEGVLVNQRDGVLMLSENAGAYYELGEHAISVSPYDVYGTAQLMHEALTMPQEERQRRASALRQIVKGADVKQWFYNQVEDALRAWKSQESNVSTP